MKFILFRTTDKDDIYIRSDRIERFREVEAGTKISLIDRIIDVDVDECVHGVAAALSAAGIDSLSKDD